MAIGPVPAQFGKAAAAAGSVTYAMPLDVSVGDLIAVSCSAYGNIGGSLAAGDLTKVAGTATIGTPILHVQRSTAANEAHGGIWTVLVTGAGSLTLQLAPGGSSTTMFVGVFTGNFGADREEDTNSNGTNTPTLADYPSWSRTTHTFESSGTHNVPMPNPSAGDLLIFFHGSENGTTTQNVPAGWTRLAYDDDDGGASAAVGRMGVYAKVAAGDEGTGNVNFSLNAARVGVGHLFHITGWHGALADGVDIDSSVVPFLGENGNSFGTNEVTASWGSAQNLFISGVCLFDDPTELTAAPPNYTNLASTTVGTTGTGAGIGTAVRELTAASDDPGNFTAAVGADQIWFGSTLVIRPASDNQNSHTSGNATSAGAALFLGFLAVDGDNTTTLGVDDSFTQIAEEEDGIAFMPGNFAYRIVDSGTTVNYNSASTGDNYGWASGIVALREASGGEVVSVSVSAAGELGVAFSGKVAAKASMTAGFGAGTADGSVADAVASVAIPADLALAAAALRQASGAIAAGQALGEAWAAQAAAAAFLAASGELGAEFAATSSASEEAAVTAGTEASASFLAAAQAFGQLIPGAKIGDLFVGIAQADADLEVVAYLGAAFGTGDMPPTPPVPPGRTVTVMARSRLIRIPSRSRTIRVH